MKTKDRNNYYSVGVKLKDILPINVGLSSVQEGTMISMLGSPKLPLTTHDQPKRASDRVKALSQWSKISSHVAVTGIRPAVDDLQKILKDVFAAEPGLEEVLGTEGMLNVRYRKPTSGAKSTKISNHAWGTAIDFKLIGQFAPGNTKNKVPRFIAVMIPFFNKEGWYSGIGFHDTMHFEVSDGKIHDWAKSGLLS